MRMNAVALQVAVRKWPKNAKKTGESSLTISKVINTETLHSLRNRL